MLALAQGRVQTVGYMDHAHSPEATERDDMALLLYRELIVPERDVYIPDEDAIEGYAMGPAKLRIGDTNISLRPHQLFIWNAFSLLRDQERGISRADVFALGFKSAADNPNADERSWEYNLRALMRKVNTVASEAIILVGGERRGIRYGINPNFRLTDLRVDRDDEARLEFAQIVGAEILRFASPCVVMGRSNEPPIELLVRDRGALATHGRESVGYRNEFTLLNFILLGSGQPLSYKQLFALGFHPHAPTQKARIEATSWAVRSLNLLLGASLEQPVFEVGRQGRLSYIRLMRPIKFVDLRTIPATAVEEIQPVFRELLRLAA